jgi:lipoate-protein ligase A
MLSFFHQSKDPHFNLAAEEFLLRERKEDFLILGINDPSVVLGKHQVAHREVNCRFTGEMNIPVIRRISGGGTVWHDHGNINFAFIRQSEQGKQVDFAYYTKPVIGFLTSLGIDAVFGGKNDITVGGLKVSGNAEHVFRERVLHHGTLLFDASVDNMHKALKPASEKYSSRGVDSNRTSVTNLRGMPGLPDDMSEFSLLMMEYFRKTIPPLVPFQFSAAETEAVNSLAREKYLTWEWNWGYGPPYTFSSGFTVSGKNHRCRFMVKDGIIWESDIEGSTEMAAAGKKLIGCRHMFEDILKVFRSENISITDDEIYSLF